MRNFISRTYNSQLFRPTPESIFDESGQLLIIATPWGPRKAAESVANSIKDYYLTARGDIEATSPFENIACLSPAANDLRVSIMLANDKLFKEMNRKEFLAGVELLVIARVENEVNWVQIGHPSMYLVRANLNIMPLSISLDLAMNVSTKEQLIAPLPNQLLGLHPTSNFSVQSLRPQENDKLILLSRTFTPPSIFNITSSSANIEEIMKIIIEDNSESPFWICSMNL